jgi:hypothetical protein
LTIFHIAIDEEDRLAALEKEDRIEQLLTELKTRSVIGTT